MEGETMVSHEVTGWGVDREAARRPGVPAETEPRPAPGVHWQDPPRQDPRIRLVKGEARTPVFGTAQPLRGLSGLLRRAAYVIPEHRARHWMLLIVADRVDALESWAIEQAAARPAATASALVVGAVALAWLAPGGRGR
jgi:hypothetical protein